ncbi:MAG: hypothetical protein Fur007_03830 [Rhodoferax sp.]
MGAGERQNPGQPHAQRNPHRRLRPLNARLSRRWKTLQWHFGIDNLLNQRYDLPTGGAYTGQGTTMTNPMPPNVPRWGVAVPGMGRSVYVGFNWQF